MSYNKRKIALIITLLLLLSSFALDIKQNYVGPYTGQRRDDLEIQRAFYDPKDATLIIILQDSWTRFPLALIPTKNAPIAMSPDIKKRSDNTLHWRYFKSGAPADKPLFGLEPVSINANVHASFSYNKDGHVWHDFIHPGELSQGYNYALYQDMMAQDTGVYILQSRNQQTDGRYGYQFFYDPGTSYSIAFKNTAEIMSYLIILGPTYLALCLIMPAAFGLYRQKPSNGLFVIAALLHVVSSFIFFTFGRIFGASSGSALPAGYSIGGGAGLFILYWMSWFAYKKS